MQSIAQQESSAVFILKRCGGSTVFNFKMFLIQKWLTYSLKHVFIVDGNSWYYFMFGKTVYNLLRRKKSREFYNIKCEIKTTYNLLSATFFTSINNILYFNIQPYLLNTLATLFQFIKKLRTICTHPFFFALHVLSSAVYKGRALIIF